MASQAIPENRDDRHREWLIEQNWLNQWEATHPDYDPTPLHLYDGPSDSRHVTANTRADLIVEIDEWIGEHGDAPPRPRSTTQEQAS